MVLLMLCPGNHTLILVSCQSCMLCPQPSLLGLLTYCTVTLKTVFALTYCRSCPPPLQPTVSFLLRLVFYELASASGLVLILVCSALLLELFMTVR